MEECGVGEATAMPDAARGLTGLAIATASQTGQETFGGVSVGGDDVLVMYTYGGDANLDGFISGDDYSTIDFNIAVPGADGYYNGDFNYDGIISGDDYSVIDFNIVAQGTPFPTTAGAASPRGGGGGHRGARATSLAVSGLLALLAGRRRRPQERGTVLPPGG